MIRTATPSDMFLLICLAAIYGSAFTAIKIAVPTIGPFGLVVARVVIGFVLLLPYAFMRGWVWPSSSRTWLFLLVLCAFNLLAPFFLISWAQQHLNASLMALIMGAGPFFGLVFSHVATRDDRLTAPKIAGVLMGFLGIALVLGVDAFAGLSGGSMEARLAQAAALLASVCYAGSGILVRQIDDIPPNQIASLVLGLGSIAMLAVVPLLEPGLLSLYAALDREALIATVYLGAVTTASAFILRYHLIQTVGMGYFGLSIYLVPVFGVAIAALWLSEPITPSLLAGLGLIMLGLAVARRKAFRTSLIGREAPTRK